MLSDHENLKGFMGKKTLDRRQARMAMALAPYNFIVYHLPGKSNPADAPSRRPNYASVTQEINGLLPVLQKKLSLSEIALADGPTSASSTIQQEEPRDARMGPAAKENSG